MLKRVMRWWCLALAVLAGAARAGDWPEFRGPTGQGLVPDGRLPVEWGSEKGVVWKQPVPGRGWSSPVVAGGRVYLTSAVPVPDSPTRDQSLRALCLDAKTGRIVWDEEVFRQKGTTAPPIHGKNSHASPTPLFRDGRLYVHFGHLGTACLDAAGKVVWRDTNHRFRPVHGSGGSPILVGDALIFSGDSPDEQFVVALDRKTGKQLWKTDRETDGPKLFSFGTPLLIRVNGKPQLISQGSYVVAAYDPANGREIWRVRHDGYSVVPRPVFGHGLVFVCTGYDSPRLLAIRPDGKGDVTATHVAWSTRRAVPLTPSPLLVGDELYLMADNGIASCLDARTGKVHWQERVGGNYSASPIYADGKIYFLSESGTGVVLRAGKQFAQLAKNELDERTLASPAAADGALFIRTERHLYRLQNSD